MHSLEKLVNYSLQGAALALGGKIISDVYGRVNEKSRASYMIDAQGYSAGQVRAEVCAYLDRSGIRYSKVETEQARDGRVYVLIIGK